MKLKDLISEYGEYEVSDKLIAQFKKPSPKTVWDLKYGDTYFGIFGDGDIDERLYGQVIDSRYIKIGNAFLTEEEAEKDVERRKVETLLLKQGGRRWYKKGEWNYYLSFNIDLKILIVPCNRVDHHQGAIYFDSEKQAKEAIDEIGSERIRKALFEVR